MADETFVVTITQGSIVSSPIVIEQENIVAPTIPVGQIGPKGEKGDKGDPGDTVAGGNLTKEVSFGLTPGAYTIAVVPPNSVLKNVHIRIPVAYNDSEAFATVGVDAFPDKYFARDSSQLTFADEYACDKNFEIIGGEEIKLFLSSSGTAGAGVASVTYYTKP